MTSENVFGQIFMKQHGCHFVVALKIIMKKETLHRRAIIISIIIRLFLCFVLFRQDKNQSRSGFTPAAFWQ